MVFYQFTGTAGEPTVNLSFLEKRNNSWNITHSIPFSAEDIEKVEFSRLGNSENQNIIISYSNLNQQEKNLRVITFDEDNRPESVYRRNFCVYYEIGDFDNSGFNTLLSINRTAGEEITEAIVEFTGWRDDRFVTTYSVYANPLATNYVKSIQSDSTLPQRTLLFLEYAQSENLFNTGIIIFSEGRRPRNIVFSGNAAVREEHLRFLEKRTNRYTAHAYARDIDGDGTVNVAGNRRFPGYSHEAVLPQDRALAAIWYKVTENERLERLYYTYLSINNDYVFFFPEEWEENVTVTHNLESGEVTFWEFDAQHHESVHDAENQLLSIISIPKDESRATGDYILFSTDNEHFNYYVKIYNEALDFGDLRNMLRIL
jgi:hypothetical protein